MRLNGFKLRQLSRIDRDLGCKLRLRYIDFGRRRRRKSAPAEENRSAVTHIFDRIELGLRNLCESDSGLWISRTNRLTSLRRRFSPFKCFNTLLTI